ARADGTISAVHASLVLTAPTTTAPTVLPGSVPAVNTETVSLPATPVSVPTNSPALALPTAGDVTIGEVQGEETPAPVVPADDSGGRARDARKETSVVPERLEQTPPAAVLDAFFSAKDGVSQEVRTVEPGDGGSVLLASAGLALGWLGLWRQDG